MKAERSYAQYNEVVQIAIQATLLLHLLFIERRQARNPTIYLWEVLMG